MHWCWAVDRVASHLRWGSPVLMAPPPLYILPLADIVLPLLKPTQPGGRCHASPKLVNDMVCELCEHPECDDAEADHKHDECDADDLPVASTDLGRVRNVGDRCHILQVAQIIEQVALPERGGEQD